MSSHLLRQPFGIRFFIVSNLLMWGFAVPIHLGLTLIIATFASASSRKITVHVWLAWLVLSIYGLGVYFLGPCFDGISKVIASTVVMSLLLLALDWLSREVRFDRPLLDHGEIRALLLTITIAAVVEYFYVFLGKGDMGIRVGGLYLEPSHLALSAIPLLFYMWIIGSPKDRLLAFTIVGVLGLISYSSTLLILILLLSLFPIVKRVFQFDLNLRALLTVIGAASVISLFLLLTNYDDTLLRFNDVLDIRRESNLSSLVYVNGWKMLEEYLQRTGGFGLGFNAMGCNPRIFTEITEWLLLAELENQNFNDGSFLLSKIGSELGYLGILLFFFFTIKAIQYMLIAGEKKSHPVVVLAAAWLAVFSIGGFVRSGGGFFSGPVILGLFSFFLILRYKKLEQSGLCTLHNGLFKSTI